jgi:hypothetical protein
MEWRESVRGLRYLSLNLRSRSRRRSRRATSFERRQKSFPLLLSLASSSSVARFLFFCRFLICFFLSLLNLVSLLLLPAARGGDPDRARQSPRLSLRGSDKENESRRENRRRRMERGNQEAIVEADAANAKGGGGAAPAPGPTPSLVVSDEAIATLAALTGGDEASARALLQVEKRRTITKTRKKGRPVVCCLLAQPPLSLSFSPSKTTNRPPPATSSRPPTSSWRAAYPP